MTTTGISRPDAAPMVLTESTIIGYLGSPAFTEDPFPAYRFFLDHQGWPSPSGYRVFARFDDVLGILRDPGTFGQPGRVDGNFHTVDPPEHTRLRKLVSRAFTFRAMSQQRQFIESVADRIPGLVAPAAAWLCHEECDASGQFFASTAGSMRLVFTAAARGYQSPDPEAVTIEELRDHWELACSREPALIPASAAEFNDFRRSILTEKVVHP